MIQVNELRIGNKILWDGDELSVSNISERSPDYADSLIMREYFELVPQGTAKITF